MSAYPVVPGHLYAVRLFGRVWVVAAKHGCDAINQMTEVMPCAV